MYVIKEHGRATEISDNKSDLDLTGYDSTAKVVEASIDDIYDFIAIDSDVTLTDADIEPIGKLLMKSYRHNGSITIKSSAEKAVRDAWESENGAKELLDNLSALGHMTISEAYEHMVKEDENAVKLNSGAVAIMMY